jgi:hypothetical protein
MNSVTALMAPQTTEGISEDDIDFHSLYAWAPDALWMARSEQRSIRYNKEGEHIGDSILPSRGQAVIQSPQCTVLSRCTMDSATNPSLVPYIHQSP